MTDSPLGKNSSIPAQYAPEILYPIPRWPSRSLLDIDKKLLMYGFDYWRSYELSWLDAQGKPQVGIAEFFFDARSENIVESKSLKLYLNSFTQEYFSSKEKLEDIIAGDLAALSNSEVKVLIRGLDDEVAVKINQPFGNCIDHQDVKISQYTVDAELLRVDDESVTEVQLHSNIFKSNCPITGQPDWATVLIEYSGRKINEAALLTYLCSFRSHMGYHEECCELLFRDLTQHCNPEFLVVGMNFTRRGGLDINPFRSNVQISPDLLSFRFARQ